MAKEKTFYEIFGSHPNYGATKEFLKAQRRAVKSRFVKPAWVIEKERKQKKK